ncbi:MBOAT family O-acyltransferase [Psychroserpens mesophilus]|uniref:MBOAT family O-acyltransferase n=1 Tax=Psychroserpens mesophilus TaxID=325473 RepID=UPI00058AD4FA|nr:MBOAT family O-acyltransferase [Psychroserpens mesophilus]
MLFNSIDFAVFLPIVFALYWLLAKYPLRAQNSLLVIASYVFYGWWDWRFLSLILFSTIVDYSIGLALNKTSEDKKRKRLLWTSIVVNIGLLMFFKYFGFFVDNFVTAFTFFGAEIQPNNLNIILPVGISFYTFQTLSYTIDVYKRKLEPTQDFIQFATFVSFFPQLVAGPIERAKHLLPQFEVKRHFDSNFAMSGVYLIIWGLFKKVVVADNCAFFVNQIFNGSSSYSSAELVLGAVLFGFQIYGDFSGYSDIAIGVARLFGFSLMVNFSFPYFSRNIAEFWRRWHISLSTWFRDYVYIPLGGSRGNKSKQIRNVLIVFLVSGFWHGANWTYIIWGAIHAMLFLPLLIFKRNRTYVDQYTITYKQLPKIVTTFLLVTLAWIFFRADTATHAINYIIDICRFESLSVVTFYKNGKSLLFSVIIVVSILVMLAFEFKSVQKHQKEVILSPYMAIFIAILITFMGVFKNPSDFIYFQF